MAGSFKATPDFSSRETPTHLNQVASKQKNLLNNSEASRTPRRLSVSIRTQKFIKSNALDEHHNRHVHACSVLKG